MTFQSELYRPTQHICKNDFFPYYPHAARVIFGVT